MVCTFLKGYECFSFLSHLVMMLLTHEEIDHSVYDGDISSQRPRYVSTPRGVQARALAAVQFSRARKLLGSLLQRTSQLSWSQVSTLNLILGWVASDVTFAVWLGVSYISYLAMSFGNLTWRCTIQREFGPVFGFRNLWFGTYSPDDFKYKAYFLPTIVGRHFHAVVKKRQSWASGWKSQFAIGVY